MSLVLSPDLQNLEQPDAPSGGYNHVNRKQIFNDNRPITSDEASVGGISRACVSVKPMAYANCFDHK